VTNVFRVAALLAVGAIGFAAGAWIEGRRADRQAHGAVERAAARVGTLVATAASASRMRADGLAAMPTVRAAIETDAATVRDMARVEGFVFTPGPFETVELFQRRGDGKPRSLWRTPENAAPIVVARGDESRVDDDGLTIVLVAARASQPLYARGALSGIVAVSTRVDPKALTAALAADGGKVDLAHANEPAGERVVRAAIPGAPALVAQATIGSDLGRQLGVGLIVAVLGAGAILLLTRRQQPSAPVRERAVAAPTALVADADGGDPEVVVEWRADTPTPISQLTPPPDVVPLAVDRRADLLSARFRLLRPIAQGPAADVYLAQAALAGAPSTVALKLVGAVAAGDRDRFLEAARRQAAIAHPHVARVLDVGSGEVPYVAMEYVEGCTLEALLRDLVARGEALPLPEVLEIVGAVCSALDAAHPLLHGAVKPSNVLLGRHDAVKLADFGAPPSPSDLHAPDRDAAPDDRRNDVYAVGVILHQLVTGRRVGTAASDAPLTPPSRLRRELPRALDDVVARATRFGSRGRHATATELYADLLRACKQSATPGHAHFGDWIDRARRSS
jgi:hypothetical protein